MSDELMTVEAFVLDRGLSMSYGKTATNPHMTDSTDMDHWMVTIHHPNGKAMSLVYSMGKGHRVWRKKPLAYAGFNDYDRKRFGYAPGKPVGPLMLLQKTLWAAEVMEAYTEPAAPLIEDVLGCLAMDAASYENAPTFEEWAADFGINTDSRKAEKTHRIIGEQSHQLKHLLGREDYEILLFKTESR